MGLYYSVTDETAGCEVMSGGKRFLYALRETLGWRDDLTEPFPYMDSYDVAPKIAGAELLKLVSDAIRDLPTLPPKELGEGDVDNVLTSLKLLRDYVLEHTDHEFTVTLSP